MLPKIHNQLILLCLILVSSARMASAERLPIKTYTIADGLARNDVGCIKQDSHGFLWFCTGEGISRFDGYSFINYGTNAGLSSRNTNDLIESRNGDYFVATNDGLSRLSSSSFTGSAEKMFQVYRPEGGVFARAFNVLVEERSGTIFCGTNGGLYRFEPGNDAGKFTRLDWIPVDQRGWGPVGSLLLDRQNRLWIGTATNGVWLLRPDGTVSRCAIAGESGISGATALLEDHNGNIWASDAGNFYQMREAPASRAVVAQIVKIRNSDRAYRNLHGRALVETPDGHIWVGGNGLVELEPSGPDFEGRLYGIGEGLSDSQILTLLPDRDGNLWLGSESGGAMKLARNGFSTYREADGLASGRIAAIFERVTGDLCVVSGNAFNLLKGRRFETLRPRLPAGMTQGWGWNQISFQDQSSDWWITSGSLLRFGSKPGGEPATTPKAVYEFEDAAPHGGVFRLFEDSKGDIWISTFSSTAVLARWERASNQIIRYREVDPEKNGAPTAFREDRNGALWIGFYQGGVARYRDGHFTFFGQADGLGGGFIRDIYVDREGRIWIATALGGLSRIDSPAAERPSFVTLTSADGLASNQVTCFVEDSQGNIFVGTGRGLDRLNPTTNSIRHYTTAEGLPDDFINVAFAARNGALWFGTLRGLARLIPGPDPTMDPPPILIGGIRVAGVGRPLNQMAPADVAGIEIGPNQNQLQIDFFSIGFTPGETARYQYRLDGVDQDWSVPGTERSVNYAQLTSGNYRFLVRALNSEGAASRTPATVSFRILPPFWRRWWFVTAMILSCSVPLLSFVYYRAVRRQERRRAREARFRELERVRQRIASDLHDDLGSSLTQISLWSEVVQQRLHHESEGVTKPLALIATSSRELIDTMSDIVWAINPQKDHLSDLVQRMRSLASDLFAASGTQFIFNAPPAGQNLSLGANLRREIFLIFKEALNNIVRHAAAQRVRIDLSVDQRQLFLQISDNGKGFNVADEKEGHGLLSMKSRSRDIGAKFGFTSVAGEGSTVTLRVPLR
ncbi:MAG TPA: two-component regulator propeller domain-containing protein [Pyrinomonadaceae bacterium]